MQITIELPPDLEQNLIRQSEQSNVPLQTLEDHSLDPATSLGKCLHSLLDPTP